MLPLEIALGHGNVAVAQIDARGIGLGDRQLANVGESGFRVVAPPGINLGTDQQQTVIDTVREKLPQRAVVFDGRRLLGENLVGAAFNQQALFP